MVTYAAIEINQATLTEIFANVSDVPDGRSRFSWALFRYPWVEGVDYFFIGGNYLGLNQLNYTRHILRKSDLDSWFTYNEKAIARKNGPRNNGSWFAVTLREDVVIPGSRRNPKVEVTALCSGLS